MRETDSTFRNCNKLCRITLPFFSVVIILLALASTATAQTASHVYLRDDATGGDCGTIGSWDQATRTCTMNHDAILGNYGVRFAADGITFNGNGFSLIGPNTSTGPIGIDIFQRTGVTLKNITVRNYVIGLRVNDTDNSHFDSNNIVNNRSYGIIDMSDGWDDPIPANNLYTGNLISGNGGDGIFANTSGDPVFQNNTISNNAGYGIIAENWGWYQGYWGGQISVLENTITGNQTAGIRCKDDGVKMIDGNSFSTNGTGAIDFHNCDEAQIRHNIFDRQKVNLGGRAGSWGEKYRSCLNRLVNNNFIDSQIVIFDNCGYEANTILFNHWSTWASPDANGDGIVDIPYTIDSNNQDTKPLAALNGWYNLGKPVLIPANPSSYWESYADYLDRLVTIDLEFINSGGNDASGVRITGGLNTSGVSLVTPVPAAIGTIRAAETAMGTFKYRVPSGVHNWKMTLIAEAADSNGAVYSYP